MLKAVDLTKQFGKLTAVDHLNLEVKKGEFFGFLGPNGAGKTTTIKMMVGLMRPTSGRVEIGDFDLAAHPLEAKRLLGFVPDQPYLYDKLTVSEFFDFVASVFQLDRRTAAWKKKSLIELFDLGEKEDELIGTLSHGTKQKVALGGALLHEPKVLLLDEPTVGLDPRSARILKDILNELARTGCVVFMSTHIMEIAEAMCDRVGIIDHGKLVAVGNLDDLRRKTKEVGATLEDLFLSLTGGSEYEEVKRFLSAPAPTYAPAAPQS